MKLATHVIEFRTGKYPLEYWITRKGIELRVHRVSIRRKQTKNTSLSLTLFTHRTRTMAYRENVQQWHFYVGVIVDLAASAISGTHTRVPLGYRIHVILDNRDR